MNILQPGMSTLLPNSQIKPGGQNPANKQALGAAQQSKEAKPAAEAAKGFDVDALVNNLWGFMKGRLADAKASGASEQEMDKLWKAAEKGLAKGFGEAKDILQSMGKLSEPMADRIDKAYDRLTETLASRDLTSKPGKNEQALTKADRQISLYQYQERSFSLDLKTREGDRVTISVVNRQEAGAQQRSGAGWSSMQWGRNDQMAFDLKIEGNLNEQERADIEALLGQVNELANEFYNGHYDLAWEKAQALSIDGSSLMSMDLNLRSVEAKGASVYEQMGGERSLPKGLAPLAQYARDLVEAQQEWMNRFNSNGGLLTALENHPLNKGQLGDMARSLLK